MIRISFQDYETYSYRLTEKGIKYAENAQDKYPHEFRQILETVRICKSCELKPTPLSYAAKTHYILNNSEDDCNTYSASDVEKIASDFNWEITSKDASDGLELLKKLGLVSDS